MVVRKVAKPRETIRQIAAAHLSSQLLPVLPPADDGAAPELQAKLVAMDFRKNHSGADASDGFFEIGSDAALALSLLGAPVLDSTRLTICT